MSRLLAVLIALFTCAAPVLAQNAPVPVPAEAPQVTPPPAPGGPPVLRSLELRFHPDNTSMVDYSTYLFYIPTRPIVNNQYTKYNEDEILADFRRLWSTNFLDNLWVEVIDEPFDNGAPAKHVIFHMEERQRVKIIDYEPHKIVDSSKIEDELRKRSVNIRLDSFLDQNTIKKVSSAIRDLYAEKGYQYAEVKPAVESMPSGPKLVHLTFNITPGPKVKIQAVDFVGNKAFSDGKLQGQMKSNKGHTWYSFITGAGTYQEAKFDEDAERIVAFYHDHGYVFARVGQPQLEVMRDSLDKSTRFVTLKIPIDEGEAYRVGKIEFTGDKLVKIEALRPLLKLNEGDLYEEKAVRKWYEKTKEIYGGAGYMEFSAFPDMDARCFDETTQKVDPACSPEDQKKHIVDLTLRMQEGDQYFVNRITFTGNTTTHDEVARRELRVLEGGVYNSESLKYSIRRLNQLGYFKSIEPGASDAVGIEKTPGEKSKVDIHLKVEEQNRNQLSFGAGISQLDGFFGQLGFQTSNFLGRGETVSLNAQKGYRARNYEVAITEPFLFGRPITTGVNVFSRQLNYINEFTQDTTGATATLGLPSGAWGRFFFSYSYQRIKVYDINSAYTDPNLINSNPFLADSLLLNEGGRRTVSKISPSYVHSTINEPIFPSDGHKYTFGLDFAGFGGNTSYVNTTVELIQYFKLSPRTSIGVRGQSQYIRPYGQTTQLPIFEKVFLGGEYSIRGSDLRAVGPRDDATGLVLGGNKNILFNFEYVVTIAGPVRLLAFFDAGQVRDIGESFGWKEPVYQTTKNTAALPLLYDPSVSQILSLTAAGTPTYTKTLLGSRDAFKTSTGIELRFFMPVVNVPFRLIGSFNPSRGGVLDNNLTLLKRFTFRFAVGTTF